MQPVSTQATERHELEAETYYYLCWSDARIARTVDRLLARGPKRRSAMKEAAREVVAAFGLAGPPDAFWSTHLGRRCASAGFHRSAAGGPRPD